MVTTTKALPADATIDTWLAGLQGRWTVAQRAVIRNAYTCAQEHIPDSPRGLAVAHILAGLNMDHEVLCAVLLQEAVEEKCLTLDALRDQFGDGVAGLLDGVAKLGVIGEFHQQGIHEVQLERLRKMLLAMAQDIRVVLIKLAGQLYLLRKLNTLPEDEQKRIARETRDIFAPLANRLGIGQIKWELEDLSLRYIDPKAYKDLAHALDERRADREHYIARVLEQLSARLTQAGIKAELSGRAKHLYSIWKKMQRKNLGIEQIFDVRAVRVMVENMSDCYAVLGVVHALWVPIRREFDDYIANPKENGYQSLHTAVVGPEGKNLEVQIRTFEMHRKAELGVAAHWLYKEGGKSQDKAFEQQIAWVRQMLEWREDDGEPQDFLDQFKSEVFQDRVYVVTPKGAILDLEQGATPLDFAYRIHTEVGHRCRGAKINGRIVPLNYELKNGDQVDVLTARDGTPSRDWLSPHLGYLKTSRARNKVRQWFNLLDLDKNIAAGRHALEQELRRLDVDFKRIDLQQIAERCNFAKPDELYATLGQGALTTSQVMARVQDLILPPSHDEDEDDDVLLLARRPLSDDSSGEIRIRGIGNLLTQMGNCCKPIPYDPIVGFITRGRGVTIHRQDCPNLLNLAAQHRERLIEVDWGEDAKSAYKVDIHIDAYDRTGLLRDVSAVLTNERANVLAVNTLSDTKAGTARMALTIEIADIGQLSRMLDKLSRLPNIIEARRKRV